MKPHLDSCNNLLAPTHRSVVPSRRLCCSAQRRWSYRRRPTSCRRPGRVSHLAQARWTGRELLVVWVVLQGSRSYIPLYPPLLPPPPPPLYLPSIPPTPDLDAALHRLSRLGGLALACAWLRRPGGFRCRRLYKNQARAGAGVRRVVRVSEMSRSGEGVARAGCESRSEFGGSAGPLAAGGPERKSHESFGNFVARSRCAVTSAFGL